MNTSTRRLHRPHPLHRPESAGGGGRKAPAGGVARILQGVVLCGAACIVPTPVQAQGSAADPVHGLWMAALNDGVVRFAPCADEPSSLCGTVVWDKDAAPGKPGDCGLRIAKLRRQVDGAWRDGWIFDPRAKKNYKGVVRMKGEQLLMRAYIGTELLGQTEEMTRVDAAPAGCPAEAPKPGASAPA